MAQNNDSAQLGSNQLLLTFSCKEEVDFILLVCRRKGYHIPNYLSDNIEWDEKLPCLSPEVPAIITADICDGCDFIDKCPDAVKKGQEIPAVKKARGRS